MNLKQIIIIGLLVVNNNLFAQEYSGIAEYGIKNNLNIDTKLINSSNAKVKSEVAKIFENSKETKNILFRLKFNTNESICKYVSSINQNESGINIMAIVAEQRGEVYTDFKLKKTFIKKPDDEDEFLIENSWENHKWKLINESKKIGKFICYKAIGERKIFKRSGKYKTSQVIAWYTPDINISSGPVEYTGLPGLIIELIEPRGVIFYLKNIVLKKDKIKIKKLKAKKTVSKKEYDSIKMEFYLLNNKRNSR